MLPLTRSARSLSTLLSILAASTLVALPIAAAPPPRPAATARPTATPAPATPGAANEVPWLYRGSDIPPDREWNFGELPNGLKYAVRRNGVPPGQVSIRIRIDAGSLNETDAEQGYAHLIEHLVFRQSRYLPDGAAIATWQRLGASFGSDTNAETSPTQTVFKIDLPGATQASLDESFKLLSGMVTAPTLSEGNIRTDVPIVMAEMRENAGPGQRVGDAMRRALYDGQPLAERSPIGKAETLRAADQASVRAFYQRWYRPDNAAIIVAGDADPAVLTALIQKWFGGWTANGPRQPTPSFGAPTPPAGAAPGDPAPLGKTDVIVEPDVPRNITYAVVRPWHQVNDNIAYNQGLMIDALAQQVINRRLESKARRGGAFLTATVSQDDVSRSVDATFVSVTPLGPDWQSALRDVRAVIADAQASPPTQDEIDREVAAMELGFAVPVEQRRLLPGARVADDLVNALDIRETVAAPEDVLRIFQETRPQFTPAAVLAHTRTLFAGTVTRGLLVTPKGGEADDAALHTAMATTPTPDASVRLAGTPVRFQDLPPLGAPGQVVANAPIGLLEIEQVSFANGVKALLWPVKDEPGRVAVKVRFGGGYRVFGAKDAPYVTLGDMALVSSGEGKLGEDELDRITAGRAMGFNFTVDDATFQFSADTRQADLADQLYLFAAKFATPRWDQNPLVRAKAAAELQYESYATSPQGVLSRDLKYQQRDRDPRYRTPTPAEIAKASPARFRKLWSRALSTGPVEVQIYGDFDKAGAIDALTRTFGALAPRPPLPRGTAPATARFPRPNARPVVLTHHGDANQAAAVVSWPTGGGSGGIRESRQLEILAQLFSNRLLDAMREKLGASYAPQVASNWPMDLSSGGSLTALAQIEPEAVPVFFRTAGEIADDLARTPPTDDELARVVEPLRQWIMRASSSSAFFMGQLQGATSDPLRIAGIRPLLNDYTRTTPAQMQALAAKYLGAGKAWHLAVMPAPGAKATGGTAAPHDPPVPGRMPPPVPAPGPAPVPLPGSKDTQ